MQTEPGWRARCWAVGINAQIFQRGLGPRLEHGVALTLICADVIGLVDRQSPSGRHADSA